VVDFITHTIDNGTLYFTVRFTDQTSFSVRYAFIRRTNYQQRRIPPSS